MKTFDEILPSFLSVVRIQVGDKTFNSYKGQTKVFSDWMALRGLSNTPLADITSETISDFFLHLASERKLDKPTCYKYFFVLRKLWQYAQKRGLTNAIPFDTVEFPKKGEDMSSEVINPEHSRILLGEIQQKDPQLYLACLTEYYCFLRPGKELRLLRVGDIDFNNGTICVPQERAKNGHKRVVTVPNQLMELYLEQGIDKYDRDMYVFGKRKRPDTRPCSVNMLRYRFNKYRDKNGMSKKYHLYSFKHTGASLLHDSRTVSMRELMDQLGHSRLSATEFYVKKISVGINTRIKESFPSPY